MILVTNIHLNEMFIVHVHVPDLLFKYIFCTRLMGGGGGGGGEGGEGLKLFTNGNRKDEGSR